jgi:integrase
MSKKTLSDSMIKATKPSSKDLRLFDGNGLYLLIKPNNSRGWRIDYTINKKRKTLSLGTYPLVTLAEARNSAFDVKKMVSNGIDPSDIRKSQKIDENIKQKNYDRISNGLSELNSFKFVADEWFSKRMQNMTDGYKSRVYSQLQRDVFPHIGNKNIAEVTSKELLAIIQKIESRGAIESSHRILNTCAQIFRYGIVTDRLEIDITVPLKGALTPVKGGHFAAVTDVKKFRELLRAIETFTGSKVVSAALKIAPHVFVRPGELRTAKWADIDLEVREWRYLVTKTNVQHIVPLSQQVIAILVELKIYTGNGPYVFPSARTPNGSRPMSDVALLAALRRMGYEKDEATIHGFRATARTLLDEVLKFRPDFIEHQLAHSVRDPLGRAYNRTTHIDERKKMMQVWSDYLAELINS